MESTKTTLYRDILIERIGFEEYMDNGPNGLMILDEGIGDFLKGLVKSPINKFKKVIDKRYERLEKIEQSYRSSLKKMGIDTDRLDKELQSIVKSNTRAIEKGVGDDSQASKGFIGIKAGLAKSAVIQSVTNRLKEFDPDVWLPAVGIYTLVVISKYLVMIFAAQYFGRFVSIAGRSTGDTIGMLAKFTAVAIIAPIVDQAGMLLSVKIHRDGQYQLVANTVNTVAVSYMAHKRIGADAFKIVLNRALAIFTHSAAGKLVKDAENMDDGRKHFYAWAMQFTQRTFEMFTLGNRMWQFPQ